MRLCTVVKQPSVFVLQRNQVNASRNFIPVRNGVVGLSVVEMKLKFALEAVSGFAAAFLTWVSSFLPSGVDVGFDEAGFGRKVSHEFIRGVSLLKRAA